MMSVSIVCLYIIFVLCFILFVNYKFLKLFITPPLEKYSADANSNSTAIPNKNATITTTTHHNDNSNKHNNNNNNNYSNINNNLANQYDAKSMCTNDVWSIPGPLRLPFFGTKWIYLWKYKMSKIHEVYRGMEAISF